MSDETIPQSSSQSSEMPTIPEGAIDISPAKDGGIWKLILTGGQGEARPANGDTCFVHYVGTLTDGTKFDSSRDRSEEFNFRLGRSQVIKAWDVAVATMKKGELCKIILKPEFGYGALGSAPRIPPNAVLIFEIELLHWEGEDISPNNDKSILRSILKEGQKYDTPSDGALVDVHVVGWHKGREFVKSDKQFFLGEASEVDLPDGVDKALKRFYKGERSLIHVKSHWAYGKDGNAKYNVPPGADVDLEIELKNFEKAKQSWEMEDDEKLAESEKLKQRGTEFFQKGKNKLAISKYNGIVDMLQQETSWDGENGGKRNALLIATHNNLAMVYLKLGETTEAIKHCDKALEIDTKNVKALYRKAQAYQNQNDFEEAIKEYQRVLDLEPSNKAARANISQCRSRSVEERKRQKAVYAGIFEKLAKLDNKNHDGKNGESATMGENGSNKDVA